MFFNCNSSVYFENIVVCNEPLKNRESQKNIFHNSHIYVYVRLYYKIPWFYQDFNSENLSFLNLYSVHAARILDLSLEVNPSK